MNEASQKRARAYMTKYRLSAQITDLEIKLYSHMRVAFAGTQSVRILTRTHDKRPTTDFIATDGYSWAKLTVDHTFLFRAGSRGNLQVLAQRMRRTWDNIYKSNEERWG